MNREFEVHILNLGGIRKAKELAAKFDELLNTLTGQGLPELALASAAPSREMSLVRTHLELASFYSKKAMASLPENQQ